MLREGDGVGEDEMIVSDSLVLAVDGDEDGWMDCVGTSVIGVVGGASVSAETLLEVDIAAAIAEVALTYLSISMALSAIIFVSDSGAVVTPSLIPPPSIDIDSSCCFSCSIIIGGGDAFSLDNIANSLCSSIDIDSSSSTTLSTADVGSTSTTAEASTLALSNKAALFALALLIRANATIKSRISFGN